MRKLLLIMCAMFALNLLAQDNLKFMNIPICGNIEKFAAELEQKGFSKLSKKLYEGEFAGENAIIYLSDDEHNNIHTIMVTFNEKTSWAALKSSFFQFKELYTEKYGRPTRQFSVFENPYYEGDGFEMQAVKLDKTRYASIYELENGDIILTITNECNVAVVYEDKVGSKINDEQKKEKALNDI